jgi:hypothetical protein
MEIKSSFVDTRLRQTGVKLMSRMVSSKTSSIRKLSKNRNEQVSFYRWLSHADVTKERLVHSTISNLKDRVENRHVLAIQDTTELNYEAHAKRVQGLGIVGNGKDTGLFVHPLLVIDAERYQGLGFAAITTWNRTKQKAANYNELPIEEKESYRWISTAEEGKSVLDSARQVTFVSDRESDIYEFLDRVPDERHQALVRARGDRKLYDNNETLREYVDQQAIVKKKTLVVPRTHNRAEREAEVSIKFAQVKIKRPKNISSEASDFIELFVVEVKEANDAQDAVHWMLCTTHSVTSVEMAEQIVEWYKQRWQIEQLFRTLKTQGLDIESSQLEDGASLTKLAIIALNAALVIMQLVLARDGNTAHKTEDIFSPQQICCLVMILPTLEGRTQKQKNPYPQSNLAWAGWIIGRLGGWKGYKCEGPIGPVVMSRGLEKFYHMYDGFLLFKSVCTG